MFCLSLREVFKYSHCTPTRSVVALNYNQVSVVSCMQLMGHAQLNYSAILPLFMPTTTTYLQLSTQSSPEHPCFRVLREKALFFVLFFPIFGAQPTNKCIQQLQDFLDIPHIWIKVIQQCPVGCLCQSHKHFFN